MRLRILLRTALTVVALDQLTKIVVVHLMGLKTLGYIALLPPWLSFRMAWNEGINFGLFASETALAKWLLIALAVAISTWVVRWIGRDHPRLPAQVSGGLLVGGAAGNVIDRLLYGAVADFLNMSCCGIENPYAFNVADIAVFAGAFGLILFTGNKNAA